MPPRPNPLLNDRRLPDFLSPLFSVKDPPSKAEELAPFDIVLEKARELSGDNHDDNMVAAAVSRAQAHQIAACFIRTAREYAELSTEELARLLGVTAAYLWDAQSFRSTRKVPLDLLLRVAYACNKGTLILSFEPKINSVKRQKAIRSFMARAKGARRKKKN
jgi:DNA-binding transcriptional regulator YiaG